MLHCHSFYIGIPSLLGLASMDTKSFLVDYIRRSAQAASPTQIYLTVVGLAAVAYLVGYIIYQRYLHPLAKFPGPFWASITNFWKVYELSTLALPTRMCRVHEKYGPVVRIGPDDLSFNIPEAIAPIYKVGRRMPKGIFYQGYVSTVPDLFSTRDENVSDQAHPIRVDVGRLTKLYLFSSMRSA